MFYEDERSIRGTDNPNCNCTVIDKDHEATIKTELEDYFHALHKQASY